MKNSATKVAALLALTSFVCAYAGTTSITLAGAKNLGSGIAYIFHCEKSEYLPVGTTPELLFAVRDSLTSSAYQAVNSQYQESLHEKRIYSISKDEWLPFKIDSESCKSLGEIVPTWISTLEQGGR